MHLLDICMIYSTFLVTFTAQYGALNYCSKLIPIKTHPM